MEKNKLRLNICGTDYVIISEDSEEYMYLVGKEVDEKMRNILDNNDKISVTMAAVLTALKYCDLSKKSEENADNLRVQIKDYLEDSSKSRMEADEARREIERMKREIQMLRMRLAERDTNVSGNQKLSKKSNYESCLFEYIIGRRTGICKQTRLRRERPAQNAGHRSYRRNARRMPRQSDIRRPGGVFNSRRGHSTQKRRRRKNSVGT